MNKIPYDPRRSSLYHPGLADNFFQLAVLDTDAELCAEMARLAYVKEETRLVEYLARGGFQKNLAEGYTNPGLQVFVATRDTDRLTVIAFRGSEPDDPSDIFTDAEFPLTPWTDGANKPIGRVHRGFADSLLDWDVLEKLIAAVHAANPRRLLLTGHSLGAALAGLAATRLTFPRSIFTFGSPRVGNQRFAQAVAAGVPGILAHERVVDCSDLVTRLPPEEFGYKHAGLLRYIDRNGRLLTEPSAVAMETDRLEGMAWYWKNYALLSGTVNSRSLADHAPVNYLSGVLGLRF